MRKQEIKQENKHQIIIQSNRKDKENDDDIYKYIFNICHQKLKKQTLHSNKYCLQKLIQEQFDKWKDSSDEYRVWNELRLISKTFDGDISETTKDLTGNWQVIYPVNIDLSQQTF